MTLVHINKNTRSKTQMSEILKTKKKFYNADPQQDSF